MRGKLRGGNSPFDFGFGETMISQNQHAPAVQTAKCRETANRLHKF
jgi:hypothetical protein